MNKHSSLQTKITGLYILANVIMLIISAVLVMGINTMSKEMDLVYQDNRRLSELSDCLDDVQESMTDYLTYKTSDSLEHYYICDQKYSEMIGELEDRITDARYGRMEHNIKNLSEAYLGKVLLTIEAKRGRNVEKYRTNYEEATKLYDYISTYISSLDSERFSNNSTNFVALSEAFAKFETLVLIIITIVVVFNSAMIIYRVRELIRPLQNLAGVANEVAEGNLDVELVEYESSDETGILTNAFNKMVVSIREYIARLRDSMEKEKELQEKEFMMETNLKDAQLKYLQAQINPHFLFNTLNACAQLAMMEDADRTYEYVQTVADFFRYNVKKQNNTVTIGEEVNLIDNYIEILNVRFSGDIHYSKQVDERLLATPMPSMILQPIVENAVNHGIREMEDRGQILLKVYRKDESVLISIKDNGKGMTESEIEKVINGNWKNKKGTVDNNGIGMDNVIARLRFYSNQSEVLKIYSEGKDLGTEVVISLPLKKSGEDNV